MRSQLAPVNWEDKRGHWTQKTRQIPRHHRESSVGYLVRTIWSWDSPSQRDGAYSQVRRESNDCCESDSAAAAGRPADSPRRLRDLCGERGWRRTVGFWTADP